MTDTYMVVLDATGEKQLSAFNNGVQIIPANVPVDASGNAIHLLKPLLNNRFSITADIIPTTVTAGSNYLTIRNPSESTKVYITRIEVITNFIGTAAATRSNWRFKRFSGVTATSNATAIALSPRQNGGAPFVTEAKFLATGIALTSGSFEGAANIDGFASISALNQLQQQQKDWEYVLYPICLQMNEGIALLAATANVAGHILSVSIQGYEE